MEKQPKKSKHDEYVESIIGKWCWRYGFSPDYPIEHQGEIPSPAMVKEFSGSSRLSASSVDIEVLFDVDIKNLGPKEYRNRAIVRGGYASFHDSREACIEDMRKVISGLRVKVESRLKNIQKCQDFVDSIY